MFAKNIFLDLDFRNSFLLTDLISWKFLLPKKRENILLLTLVYKLLLKWIILKWHYEKSFFVKEWGDIAL